MNRRQLTGVKMSGGCTRIHITGASGAGVTTLGRILAQKIDGTCYDADDFYWLPTDPPFRTKRDPAERVRLLREALTGKERWVIAGSLDGWGKALVPLFDLVVFLFASTDVRLARLRTRERERFGVAIDPGGSMHETHEAFIKWAACYDDGTELGRSLRRHRAWLKTLPCPVLELDGARPIDELADTVLKYPRE